MEKTALLIVAVTLCLLQACVTHVSARVTLVTHPYEPPTTEPILGYG